MKNNQKPDYDLFKNWFTQNGGLFRSIVFPSVFPPVNYIGVAASQDIKANQVFLAIPKKLIISVSKVRDSALGPILQQYKCLNQSQNDDTDFNILTLYLIWQKMLGKNSFFYPYLQALQKAQTIINWEDQDIKKMKDPFIKLQLVQQLRQQFPPVFQQFLQISENHQQLFKQPINWQLFLDCYSIVMTRCFGWGLPQTMLVPFADFLNHNCQGVHHYILNKELQQKVNNKYPQYTIKRREIDITILNIDNKSELPISYEPNSRQKFVQEHKHLLQGDKQSQYNSQERLHSKKTRQYLHDIHKKMILENIEVPLFLSSDSQDNDSQQQYQNVESKKQHLFSNQLKRISRQQIQHKFQQPEPEINKQFEQDVNFDWWDQCDQKQSYFIVSTSRFTGQNEQIFNSYGRRSNRFLLIWYGFTHFNNKYDSVCFRFWDQEKRKITGRLTFVKYITQKDVHLQLQNKQNGRFNITDEFRLKRSSFCYQMMAYLRLRAARNSPIFKPLLTNKMLLIQKIQNLNLQLEMLKQYNQVLSQLSEQYKINEQRQLLSTQSRNYFAHLLVSSSKQIIQNHLKGVKMAMQIIQNLIQGHSILDTYNKQLQSQKIQYPVNSEMSKQQRYENRKFILDYIKMLSRFQSSNMIQ